MHVTLACQQNVRALSSDQLMKVINDRLSELVPALTSGLNFYSENAHYTEGSLEIFELRQLSTLEYSMSYRYQWYIFNACIDIYAQEYLSDSVRFSLGRQELVFDIIDNSRPSTADEL
ncbi:hypothetical protein [Serratia odorifera]|jgi:hypothetical protein|uniref:Uncharacterized protein n=2 Tax=Serratia odorifera TaxID=618 RepID=D4DW79_SEROD|nr:hypothetical protein [Serratia odorifera]EFE98134.1 hypothetical protein HMPREF0758_0179 [Serratia odorifera DSM 4582]MBJ2065659.1 hypothetical protein [Serratia odorifera]PNK92591.1 hypothetical protein CEQ31_024505 [Serratia odorifera]RII73717.1 hypothetical protein DX901_02015 [Serratia odorifera]VDZ51799.1 Uncharacterised protein [Serratia odorifera]